MPTTLSSIAIFIAALVQPASTVPQPAANPAAAPTAAAAPAPKVVITVNSDDAPDLKEWGEKAKSICEEWYPKLVEELNSDGFKPREKVDIVFKPTMRVPAATGGGTISVNADYVNKHKDDFGMMVHELVHVVQAYPRQKGDMGWLVEGIADYIRFWKYEPQTRQRPIDKEKASYKNSYRISAAFLGWLVANKDKEIVNKLNAKLRQGGADETIFKELLDKTVDELWKEFIEAGAPAAPPKVEEKKPTTDAVPPTAPKVEEPKKPATTGK